MNGRSFARDRPAPLLAVAALALALAGAPAGSLAAVLADAAVAQEPRACAAGQNRPADTTLQPRMVG